MERMDWDDSFGALWVTTLRQIARTFRRFQSAPHPGSSLHILATDRTRKRINKSTTEPGRTEIVTS
eukprot:1489659-Prymnesium_polylepis.1